MLTHVEIHICKGMVMASLESLPSNFMVDVLVEVAKTSWKDFFNASLTSKAIKSLSENEKIDQHIELTTVALTVKDVNTSLVHFFHKWYSVNNPRAIFFKGMVMKCLPSLLYNIHFVIYIEVSLITCLQILYFKYRNVIEGMKEIHCTTVMGDSHATYRNGMLMMTQSKGTIVDGIQYLDTHLLHRLHPEHERSHELH
ncbi:hypothetical protein Syun_001202 [Stephania yunnanensis]|uniref:F-box domain-containing protein n=1 Tax=Stephania yunnanensis TaxID=152371 RepID=A0AAP0LDA5_9MAGN